MIRRLQPRLEEIFEKYLVAPEEVERIVYESLVVLGVRRARVGDADSWLLEAVECRCRQLDEEGVEEADGVEN